MNLTYIDESDHGDAYYTTALLLTAGEVTNVVASLEDIMRLISQQIDIDPNTEIHGYSILSGSGDWKVIKSDYEKQKAIFSTILAVILNFDIKIFYKGILRSRFVPNYGDDVSDIHHAALVWNLEKIQMALEASSEFTAVIADEIGVKETYVQTSIYRYKNTGTFGWDSKKLNRILDTIYFCPSSTSRMLQAADILSYAHKIGHTISNNNKLNEYYNSIWGQIVNSGKVKALSCWS